MFRRSALLVLILASISASPAATQEPASTDIQVTAFPTGRYFPGRWGVVGIQASNPGDKDGEALLAVYLGQHSQDQFARRLWVPARSQRRTWLPIRIPEDAGGTGDSIEMSLLLLKQSATGEVMKHRDGTELKRTILLAIDKNFTRAAAIFRKSLPDEKGNVADLDADAYEFMVKGREMVEKNRIITDANDDLLPSHALMWQSIDQVHICSDRIRDDSAGLAVLRDWLFSGGRMCIFIDRVSPETVAAILGHSLCYREVDRVDLTDFTIESATQGDGRIAVDRRSFEKPVSMVRVVTDSQDVSARVNGWPAAFWQTAGRGTVMFVALGPRGWIPAPIGPGEDAAESSMSVDFRQLNVLQLLSERFCQPKSNPLDYVTMVQPMLQEQIGYQIPGRPLAAGLLGLNVVVLLAASWWCGRRGRLDWLAGVLPLVVLITTGAFLLIGRFNSRSVPPTAAFTQFIQVRPETGDSQIAGLAAFYEQQNATLEMSGGSGGYVQPTMQTSDGSIHRLVWGDEDRGQWQNIALPGGSVRFATFHQPTRLNPPVEATVWFGERGVEGRVDPRALGELSDTVIANPPALPLAIRVGQDGTFSAGQDDVLPIGQYLADRFLSDASRRRQEVYRLLLNPADELAFPTRASLLGWSPPVPAGLDWPEERQQVGTALVSIPLQLNRTPPGQSFAVPSTFIRTELGTSQTGQSMTYNPRTGKWIEDISLGTRTRLRFALPEQVLPCELNGANLSIKLNAPSRTLEVYAVVNGEDQLIERKPDPIEVYDFPIRPEHLQLDEEGGVQFTIVITESEDERKTKEEWQQITESANKGPGRPPSTDPDAGLANRPTSFTTWRIEYVRLDVKGRTK